MANVYPSRRAKFLLLLSGVLLSFVFAEIFLRVFDPIGIVYYFDARRYFLNMTPDPDVGYVHTPGYRATLQGVDVAINSEGHRGPEFRVEKEAARKRLFILGDSMVFGWGAPQDSIFSAYIRRTLQRDAPAWDVIEAGVGSWNVRTEYEFLRKRGVEYAPDVLLLLLVPNDVQPKRVGRTAVSLDRLFPADDAGLPARASNFFARAIQWPAKHSYAWATVQHIFKRRAASGRMIELYEEDSPAWQDTADALQGIANTCEEIGSELVVFLYGDPTKAYSRTSTDAFADYLERIGVANYTLPVEVYDSKYRNTLIDGHPGAAGHRLMAEAMLEKIRPLL